MANSVDSDQLASSEGSQLIWIYTVCKDRVYLGSEGQGLIFPRDVRLELFLLVIFLRGMWG